MAIGNAAASIVKHERSFDGLLPATVTGAVSGWAAFAPDSFSFAEVKSGHHFLVTRVDDGGPLSTVVLPFSFTIAWNVDLSITTLGTEFAAGGAYFALSGFRDGIAELDLDGEFPGAVVTGTFPDGSNGWEFNPNYFEFDGSPVDESHEMTITVFSGHIGAFSVITDAAGRAASIPLPASAWLLLAGLLAAGATRRR